jgi:hypothetical protein
MLPPRSAGVSFQKLKIISLLALVLLVCESQLIANEGRSVFCRQGLTRQHQDEIAEKLQRITGWFELNFDNKGVLKLSQTHAIGGSASARTLVADVLRSPQPIILEETNRRADIAFSQVSLAVWKTDTTDLAQPAYIISIDFSDFEQLDGDPLALAAFDVGWVLLHEFDHVINGSTDLTVLEDSGECEANINRMRQESDLPIRAHYLFTYLPVSANSSFVSNWVRLPFERTHTSTRSKGLYWLVWDSNLVGGTIQSKQVASVKPF